MKKARLRPTAEFAAAIHRAGLTQTQLAVLVGYSAPTNISQIASRHPVRATPRALERIHQLAAVIGYAGQIFVVKDV